MYSVETSEFRRSSKENTDTANNLFCCLKSMCCICVLILIIIFLQIKILSSTQYNLKKAKLQKSYKIQTRSFLKADI